MIIKCNPSEFKNNKIIHPLLRYYKKQSILDYRLHPRTDNIIPQHKT